MKVAIVGGGACGLALARILEEENIDYDIFEKSLCGRKLLASGNGKANLGNMNLSQDMYNAQFGYELVTKYHQKLLDFFKRIGLYIKVDKEGRIYPYSESSLSVLQCLMKRPLHRIENYPIQTICKINEKFYLNDVRGPYDYLVLASGSMASFIKKKQENFNSYLTGLQLKMKPTMPSLVGFKLDCDFKRLNGVRIKCVASLVQNQKKIYSEAGEVIFKIDGISGICILNLSSIYARLENKSHCTISLDLIPDLNLTDPTYDDLTGILHPKLVEYFMTVPKEKLQDMLHNFSFQIIGVYDYEFAQVVSGGIDLSEIKPTLQLKKDKHIFVGGEILDIDGMCGGYNLMFAFSCALKIGEELCNIK